MAGNAVKEQFRPPANVGGSGAGGPLSLILRKAADLQVASVLKRLGPWLAERKGTALEVGCGAQPYRRLLNPACEYRALDWERAEENFGYKSPDTVYYSGGAFPFPDASFDSVFHTEVIEHVYDAAFFLKECRRTLKPGGEMMMTVPFQARYHYIPNDYWRFTPASLEKLLRDAGFQNVNIYNRGADITVAAYKIVSLTYRWLQGGAGGKIIGLLSAPFAVLALIAGHLSMALNIGSPDDCLGYIAVAS